MKTTFNNELKKIQRNAYLLARSDIGGNHPQGVEVLNDIFDYQLKNLFREEIKRLVEKKVIYMNRGFHDVDEFYNDEENLNKENDEEM